VTVADSYNSSKRSTPFKIIEINNIPRTIDNSSENEKKFIEKLTKHDLSQYDVIHTHEWRSSYFLHRFKFKTVYTSHTPTWLVAKGRKRLSSLLRICLKKHEYTVIKETVLTIALGNYFKIKGANIKVIPSGIHANNWKNIPLEKDKFTLTFVGRVIPSKGVHILLDAIKNISFPIEVFIIGSLSGSQGKDKNITDYSNKLIKQAKNLPVTFTGFIYNNSEEFKTYLSKTDLFVFPSFFESQGAVVLEALSMGIPVIASRVGGIPLMVNDSIGRLFTPGNSKELTKHISELYYDEKTRIEMASKAREHVIQNFSWQECAQNYIKEMSEAINVKDTK
jgi:glycosyltransferase involved in cell wall biosynthesis